MKPDQAAAWDVYQQETGAKAPPYDVFAFGDSPALADELLDLVLAGTKQATASRLAIYDRVGLRPPQAGDVSLVLDGDAQPVCIIESTYVEIAPFDTASEDFARIEGEGDKSLEYWRRVHLEYFRRECAGEGTVFNETEEIVFEHFRLIWTLGENSGHTHPSAERQETS